MAIETNTNKSVWCELAPSVSRVAHWAFLVAKEMLVLSEDVFDLSELHFVE